MNISLFQGELVRLTAMNPETDAELFARWGNDSEYLRMLDTTPAYPWPARRAKEEFEKLLEKEHPLDFLFMIRALADDRPIGFVELDGIEWTRGDCYVGIGIGEREAWDKGYGTDAMHVILRYAFMELDLHRVSLNVFEYNPRAIRSYEKAGFVLEGRQREFLDREGKRWDVLYMGILRKEWEQLQHGNTST